MEYGNGITNQLVWKNTNNRYHNEAFEVDEDNINVNVAILGKKILPEERVLDVGCGEGKLGKIIKQKGCHLIGIDIDSASCQGAMNGGAYEKVLCFNIESPDKKSNEYEFLNNYGKFDKIALIDVLEHVMNPSAVILNLLAYLKDNGKILVSIPNVNNADIFLNLLRDRFNYREAGVLDNTHVKYFTKRSFVEWISEMNQIFDIKLDCEYLGSTFGYTEYLNEIKMKLPNVYQFVQLNPYFNSIQHLFVLTYNGEGCHNLYELLAEETNDLTNVLEKILSEHVASNDLDGYPILLLPNERSILEERCVCAEEGWKVADKKLQEYSDVLKTAREKIEEQSEALEVAREKIEEQSVALEVAREKIEEQKSALEESHRRLEDNMLDFEKANLYMKKCECDIKLLKAEIDRLNAK